MVYNKVNSHTASEHIYVCRLNLAAIVEMNGQDYVHVHV